MPADDDTDDFPATPRRAVSRRKDDEDDDRPQRHRTKPAPWKLSKSTSLVLLLVAGLASVGVLAVAGSVLLMAVVVTARSGQTTTVVTPPPPAP